MKLSSRIKPISYLKAHAAEIIRNPQGQGDSLIITQNGEAKVVLQDMESNEQTQETMALLKMLALGSRQIEEGKVQPAADVIQKLRSWSKGDTIRVGIPGRAELIRPTQEGASNAE